MSIRSVWWRGIFAALTVGLCLAGAVLYRQNERAEPSGAPPPNVLLISIDTLRPDHLGCYGYHRDTSPRIDRLAAESVLFENHISSTSWTLPAHAALFTSLPDSVHGCTDTDKTLPRKLITLAERFAAADYQTAGFFSGPYLHPAFGLDQGFDHYENCTSYAKALDAQPVDQWSMDHQIMRASHRDMTNPTVYGAVKKWLDEREPGKFFMFVHMWDAHFDFIPPPPYDTMFDPGYTGTVTGTDFFFDPNINADMPPRDLQHLIALYDGEIRWTDYYVGRIIDDLARSGLLEQTVVVITSDHGTEFFEHGFKAHRMTLFDEVIRIPLLIRYPPLIPKGVRIRAQTRIIDLAPTLLELAGLPPATEFMGHSLVSVARKKTVDFDNLGISELFSVGRAMRSIRTREWKLTDDMVQKQRYYIDLIVDPDEHYPRPAHATEYGQKLLDRYKTVNHTLDVWRSRVFSDPDQPDLPEEVLKQLESLGYIERD